jgi:threonine dehydrogenase-like Zn-dependent dehydrogenase
VVNEIIVVGSRCGPFAPALEALRTGRVAVSPMIHARFPLEQGAQALARAAEPGVLKVLVDVDQESQAAPAAQQVRPPRREARNENP